MHEDTQCLGQEERFRHIEEAVVDLIGVPGVLHLIIALAVLVGGYANDFHPVVVGSLLAVEHLLAHLLSNLDFLNRSLDVELLCLTLLVAEFYPAREFGPLHIGGGALLGHHGETFIPFEAALAHVGRPDYRVTLVNGIVDDGLQFVERYILVGAQSQLSGTSSTNGS